MESINGKKIQTVGDDSFVTQSERLAQGIESNAANAILVKLESSWNGDRDLETMNLAKQHAMNCVISHRSGETEDTTISDLAVGTRAGQIKTGAPCRSDRGPSIISCCEYQKRFPNTAPLLSISMRKDRSLDSSFCFQFLSQEKYIHMRFQILMLMINIRYKS